LPLEMPVRDHFLKAAIFSFRLRHEVTRRDILMQYT
jgi:hypothetical protein